MTLRKVGAVSPPDELPGEELIQEHRDYLIGEGVDEDYLDRHYVSNSLRSITDRSQLPEELHWTVTQDEPNGIIFGWGVPTPSIVQFRPDSPACDVEGNPIAPKYVFIKNRPGNAILRSDPTVKVEVGGVKLLLTEGPKQSLVLGSAVRDTDLKVAGFPGCYGWSSAHVVAPDVARLCEGVSEVYVVLDGDANHNRKVFDAGMALKKLLTRAGRKVFFVQVPLLEERGTTGIDDYLKTVTPEDREQAVLDLMSVALDHPAAARPPAKENTTGADAFFSLNGSLVPNKVVDEIMATRDLLIVAETEDIAVYDTASGVYVIPEGEGCPAAVAAMVDLMGPRYHRRHVQTVVDVLKVRLKTEGRYVEAPEPHWVHVDNGWLNWRTGELQPHSSDRRSTYKFQVTYDPEATCPQIDKFLSKATTLDDGCDQRAIIYDTLAQLLEQHTSPSKALYMAGEPRAGKGTLSRLLEEIVPERLTAATGLQDLAENRFARADLFGALLNSVGEAEQKYIGDTSIFNKALGADWIAAEFKGKPRFRFRNRALWVLSCNDLPHISDVSGAFLARVTPVQFPHSNVGREDRKLGDRLKTELPGFFNRLIEAANARKDRDGSFLAPHPSVEAWFHVGTNPLASFMQDCVIIAPEEAWVGGKTVLDNWIVPDRHLYKVYKEHCADTGRPHMQQTRFLKAIQLHPFNVRKGATRGNRRGFACRAHPAGFDDPSLMGVPHPLSEFGKTSDVGEHRVTAGNLREARLSTVASYSPPKTQTEAPKASLPEMFPLPDLSKALTEARAQVEATRGDSPNHLEEVLESSRRNKRGWAVGDMSGIHTLGVQHLRRVGADDDVVAEYLGILRDLWKANPRYNADGSPSKH